MNSQQLFESDRYTSHGMGKCVFFCINNKNADHCANPRDGMCIFVVRCLH